MRNEQIGEKVKEIEIQPLRAPSTRPEPAPVPVKQPAQTPVPA